MSHHSDDIHDAMMKKFMESGQSTQRAADEEIAALSRPTFGATGKFPNGKMTPADQGEIVIGIARVDGRVVVNFGKAVAWLGLKPGEARGVADALTKHANEASGHTPVPKTRAELQAVLAEQLNHILGNNITSEALHARHVRADQLIENVRLYERLGVALEAIKALRNGIDDTNPRGFVLVEKQP